MKRVFLIIISCFLMISAHASLEEIFGNGETGDSCRSDYECQTLCCNNSKGTCSDHDPKASPAVFCSKEYGQSCLSSEFCKAEYVSVCKLIKIEGANGPSCTLRCASKLINGTCEQFKCVPPITPPTPSSDDCSSAVDP